MSHPRAAAHTVLIHAVARGLLPKAWPAVLALLTALLLSLLSPAVLAATPVPRPVGYVNDFAGVIPPDVEAPFEDSLRLFEKETTVELVVVTVRDLGGSTVEDYADRLFNRWSIGKKDVDNGVLLLLAVTERDIRIEVGYGMEPYLTDGQAGRILDTEVLPDLRQNNYALGLLKGARAVAETIKSSGYEPGSVRPRPLVRKLPLPFQGGRSWALMGLAAASLYAVSYMSRSKSFWFGGVWGVAAGGLLGWVLGTNVLLLLGLAVGLGVLGLGLDAVLSSAYTHQKHTGHSTRWHRSWGGFSGGGRGGWSGGKGGFGGFGGGRSGGGGASRRF